MSSVKSPTQVLLRLSDSEADFIDRHAGGARKRASYLRHLIALQRRRVKRREMEQMFAEAAASLSEEEREEERAERSQLVGAFAAPE